MTSAKNLGSHLKWQNCWYSNKDGDGESVHVFLLEFSKALDKINHKILIEKIHLLNVDNPLLNWVIDLLAQRRQRVKLGTNLSDRSMEEFHKVQS